MPPNQLAPEFRLAAFSCLHCMTRSTMSWGQLSAAYPGRPNYQGTSFWMCSCDHCGGQSVWKRDPESNTIGELVFPWAVTATAAHENMPADCLPEFEEAREICERSPRGAAALLRLCLQKLLGHIGGKGEHIDTDIKSLVAQGLDAHVQQALDVIRVTGNNAVHPLEMNLDDDRDSVVVLFEMINFIVEERIGRPQKTQDRFANLPEKARQAIEKRDRPKS